MKATDINEVKPILRGLIHNAIIRSVDFVVKKCRTLGSRPEEPDFIASLTLNFTSDLANILKAVFPRNKFSLTGVYCHQKPLANIGLTTSPEIGDILLVYIYTDNTGSKKFNSLLLQAKRSSELTLVVPTSERHQLKLYTEWPKFIYERAGRLNGISRDILPKTINDGAQYLLIDKDPILELYGRSGAFPMGCAIPARILSIHTDFASEIVNFLMFKSGRAFEENPTITKDDWTKMIWDILDITKGKASRRNNVGLRGFQRQNVEDFDGCCYTTSESKSIYEDLHRQIDNGNNTTHDKSDFNDDNSVPSVILIESSELIEE